MSNMEKIAVWGFRWAPPFAQGLVRDLRVRWALEEAGRAYESRLIGIEELDSDSYRRKHPFGMVPVLESGDQTFIESGAIVHSISEDCAALMPADRRTETLAWMFVALNTVEPPVQNLSVMVRLGALSEWIDGRDYLLGRFTAADILMTTVLRLIRHTDRVAGFSVLDAYVKRCEARPAFQKALSDQMRDYARNAPVAA
jgi:glutathione S-transferase